MTPVRGGRPPPAQRGANSPAARVMRNTPHAPVALRGTRRSAPVARRATDAGALTIAPVPGYAPGNNNQH